MVANEDLEKAKTYLNQVSWADGLMFAPKNMKEIPLLLNILGQGWVYPEEEKQSPFVIGPEPGPLGLPSSTLPLGHQVQMWACTSQVYCRWPRSELSFHCLLSSQCANLELQCLWWSFSEPHFNLVVLLCCHVNKGPWRRGCCMISAYVVFALSSMTYWKTSFRQRNGQETGHWKSKGRPGVWRDMRNVGTKFN